MGLTYDELRIFVEEPAVGIIQCDREMPTFIFVGEEITIMAQDKAMHIAAFPHNTKLP